jgi:hypothetical protein
LIKVRSFAAVVSKLVPLTVSVVPDAAMFGENPLIVGAFAFPPIAKDEALLADPLGVVTAIGPVAAPNGTVATS